MSDTSSSVADILASLGITAIAGDIVLGGVRPFSTSVDVAVALQNLMVIDVGSTSQTTATATLQTANTALSMASGIQGSVSTSDGGRTITFAGTLDQINADLAQLSYLSAAAVNDTVTLSVTDGAGNTKSASFAVSVLPTTSDPGAPTTGSYVQATASGQNATLSGGNQIYTADNKTDIVVASGVSSSVTGGAAGSSLTLVQDGGSYDFTNKSGSTLLVANEAPGTIHGGAAGSRLVAFLQDQPTTYIGGSGNDELIGGAGNMTVMGGAGGSLTVFGGAGTMQFQGGSHDLETVVGGSGRETIHAAASGGDYFGGSGGSQMFATGTGNFLIGAVNGDVLTASSFGGDGMVAGAGNETLNGAGSTWENVLFAGSGSDTVMLGHGADSFVGGSGTATVQIGSGHAALFVGSGAERFSFQAGRTGGSDVISHFRVGTDHLQLSGGLAVAGSSSGGGMTSIRLTDGTQIHLAGVSGVPQASLFG